MVHAKKPLPNVNYRHNQGVQTLDVPGIYDFTPDVIRKADTLVELAENVGPNPLFWGPGYSLTPTELAYGAARAGLDHARAENNLADAEMMAGVMALLNQRLGAEVMKPAAM